MIRWGAIMIAAWAGSAGAETITVERDAPGLAPVAVSVTPAMRPDAFPPAQTEPAPALLEAEGFAQVESEVSLRLAAAQMRDRVATCWTVGAIAERGEVATVTLAFSLTPDGRTANESFQLIEANADDPELAELAFQAARRAVIRCAGQGYDMPAELFAQWQNIEMTFDPSQMRLR